MSGKHCWHISLFAYWPLMKLCSSDGKWSVIRDDKCLYEASHQVRLCVIAQDQHGLGPPSGNQAAPWGNYGH